MEDVKLLDIIRENANSERKSIVADANAEAGRMLDAARRRADEELKEARDAIRLESMRLREQKLNSLRYRLNVKRYDYKARAVSTTWKTVESRINKIIESDIFPALLENFIMECVGDVPKDASLYVPVGRSKAIGDFLKTKKLTFEIEEIETLTDGIEFHWPENTVVLRNTLRDRLDRFKADSGERISNMLFDGAEDAL